MFEVPFRSGLQKSSGPSVKPAWPLVPGFRWLTGTVSTWLLAFGLSFGMEYPGYARAENTAGTLLKPEVPHYLIQLNLNEFLFLSLAEVDGLMNYGGSGDFQIKLARVGSEVVWSVTINDPRFLDLLGIFVGERTMKVVQGLDPNKIDPNDKSALMAIKTLSKKLELARKNPIWTPVTVSGIVVQEGSDWMFQSKQGNFRVTGDKLEQLKSSAGKAIVANGFIKIPGQLEITHFLEKRENALEIFVMGLCPFAQQAETAIYDYLAQTNVQRKVNLELHYILYKQERDGKEVFGSLHGEEEVTEDLVQIVLRDRFPSFLEPYVRLRANSGKVPWRKVAEDAGVPSDTIAAIELAITSERNSLLQREYDYVFGQQQITDYSPTYVWESERVSDIKQVEVFKGLDTSGHGQCLQ